MKRHFHFSALIAYAMLLQHALKIVSSVHPESTKLTNQINGAIMMFITLSLKMLTNSNHTSLEITC